MSAMEEEAEKGSETIQWHRFWLLRAEILHDMKVLESVLGNSMVMDPAVHVYLFPRSLSTILTCNEELMWLRAQMKAFSLQNAPCKRKKAQMDRQMDRGSKKFNSIETLIGAYLIIQPWLST